MSHNAHEQQKRWHQSFILLLLLGLVAAASLLIRAQIERGNNEPQKLGMTYSTKYAHQLGLDTHKTFLAMMDELGAKTFRLPVYWSDVEKQKGKYDWNETKWMISEAEKRGAEITIAIGMRAPRYPECHIPTWAQKLDEGEFNATLLTYIREGVRELHNYSSVVRFQVENEPYFEYFGECPKSNQALLEAEWQAAKEVTTKPIMTTSSGEFGSWIHDAKSVDVLGISMYRGARFSNIGYFSYPIPSWYYAFRYAISQKFLPTVLISELQVEPWFESDPRLIEGDDQQALMSIEKIKHNVEFSQSTGFDEAWLWGPEWWYYMKVQHDIDAYWNVGKELFKF